MFCTCRINPPKKWIVLKGASLAPRYFTNTPPMMLNTLLHVSHTPFYKHFPHFTLNWRVFLYRASVLQSYTFQTLWPKYSVMIFYQITEPNKISPYQKKDLAKIWTSNLSLSPHIHNWFHFWKTSNVTQKSRG